MGQKANASAAARTVPIPGVDMREQEDLTAPVFHGPLLRRTTLRPVGEITGTHLVRVDHPDESLCGITVPVVVSEETGEARRDEYKDHGKVCLACHVEASKIRGVVK